jgi:hypothetical protein
MISLVSSCLSPRVSQWSQAEADPSTHTVHSERIKVIFLPPEGSIEEPVPADTTFLSVNDSVSLIRYPFFCNSHFGAAL